MKYLLTALFGIPNLVTDEKAYTHILIIAQSFGAYRHKILFLR
jgi:hypothetical protein